MYDHLHFKYIMEFFLCVSSPDMNEKFSRKIPCALPLTPNRDGHNIQNAQMLLIGSEHKCESHGKAVRVNSKQYQ